MKISQEEKDRNKQQMIDAATTLIAEQGFAKVSLRDISKKAGMSQASAYKYFQSKENIVFAFFEQIQEQCHEQLLQINDFHDFCLEEQLQCLIETQMTLLEPYRVFLNEIHHSTMTLQIFQTMTGMQPAREKMCAMIDDLYGGAIDAGEIPQQRHHALIVRLFWDYLFLIILYWLRDNSAHYTNTTQLIEKSLLVITAILRSQLLDKSTDLINFVIREHVFSLFDSLTPAQTPIKNKRRFMEKSNVKKR